jgi:membrane protein YqaA with SNARE-associated domain
MMPEFLEIGYWSLFVGSFLAATILPFSSEVMLLLMLGGGYDVSATILVASLGNWFGGISGYFLGYLGKLDTIEKYLKVKVSKLEAFKTRINQYGSILAFFCWLPIIGDPLAIGLGLFRCNPLSTFAYMLLGKLARYWLVYLLFKFGSKIVL